MKKIEIFRTSFLFLLLFCLSGGVIFWGEIFSFWCLSLGKVDTEVCNRYFPEFLYNEVIVGVKSGNIIQAEKLFSRIPSSHFDTRAEYFELAGDMLYKKNENTLSMLENYEKSRALISKERVDQKIQLLKNISQKEEKKLSTQTGGVSISSLSGSNSLIKTEREKIENDEANRSKFLSFPNTTDSKSILQDTIDFIDTGKERVDW